MSDQEANLFGGLKEQYKDLPIPENIDLYIKRGISKVNRKRKVRRQFRISLITASLLLFLLIGSIRVSPSLAMYMNNIPVFSKVVELIYFDKGLKSAVDHGYVQSVGESAEYDDLTVTIDQVIIDEEKMVLFYTVNEIKNFSSVRVSTDLFTLDDERYAYGSLEILDYKTGVDNSVFNKVEFALKEEIPNDFILKVDLDAAAWNNKVNSFSETLNLEFSVNKTLIENESEIISLNETVEVEGQWITFESLSIYPTRTELKMKFDESNTKKISGFNDLRIVDNKANEWNPLEKDNSPYLFKETEAILFLESSYFEELEEMYITFSSIRAVDKDKLDLLVDLDEEIIMRAPDDKISLYKVNEVKFGPAMDKLTTYTSLNFMMQDDYQRDILEFAWEYTDMKQNFYLAASIGTMGEKTKTVDIPQEEYNNPIKLRIVDYPSTIHKDVRLKIK
ncbi:DUF4179 domain-containing protein [Chengkuizengella sp. SCS-71B]|uniref:DUF4179 domain-containing protein n=1 Tax=Chengkuizengella sp. SCS-71B TaxID=3115290 RepID=UPI0032C2183D